MQQDAQHPARGGHPSRGDSPDADDTEGSDSSPSGRPNVGAGFDVAAPSAQSLGRDLDRSGFRTVTLQPDALRRNVSAARQEPFVPVPGAAMGEWLLEARVGRGATGEVWRARHHVWSERVVALKFATNPEYVHSIRHDGLVRSDLSLLDSPHLVRVLGLNVLSDPPYLVMEYVPGSTLRERLAEVRKLSLAEALRIFGGVVKGLAAAHSVGIVHRDLKPENVLIDREGTARLTDFSVAVRTATEESLRMSLGTDELAAQSIAGTLIYMSPEQRSGARAEARSDVFSMGVLLFEMLTGELPQPGDRIGDYVAGIPESVEEFFNKCFSRPERRFANAGAMLEALDGLRRAGGGKASTGGELPPSVNRRLGRVKPQLSTRELPDRNASSDEAAPAPVNDSNAASPVLSTRNLPLRPKPIAADAIAKGAVAKGAVAKQPDQYQPTTPVRQPARPTGVDELERLIRDLPDDKEHPPASAPAHTPKTAPAASAAASTAAERALKPLPSLRTIYQRRELSPGLAAYANGDYRRAADEFRKLVELRPGDPATRRGLAMSLYQSGRPKEALAVYSGMVQRREDTAEIWNNIGAISMGLGRLREAERALLRAIEMRPRYAPAHTNLAGVYQQLGKPDLARQQAKIALDIDPENLAASFNMTM